MRRKKWNLAAEKCLRSDAIKRNEIFPFRHRKNVFNSVQLFYFISCLVNSAHSLYTRYTYSHCMNITQYQTPHAMNIYFQLHFSFNDVHAFSERIKFNRCFGLLTIVRKSDVAPPILVKMCRMIFSVTITGRAYWLRWHILLSIQNVYIFTSKWQNK